MENKRKSTQTFLCQVNLTTHFAPGKLPHDAQIGTSLPEENERPKGLRNYSHCSEHKIQPWVISCCKAPLVTVSECFSYC